MYHARLLKVHRKLEKTTNKESKHGLLRTITTHSVMTWAHINMLGEYDFDDKKLKDSVGILTPKLAI